MGLQATLIISSSIGLGYVILWIRNNYLFNIDWRSFYKISGSTIISYILCMVSIKILDFNPLLEVIISSLIFFISYIFLTIITRTFNKNEIKNIQNILPQNKLSNNLFNKLIVIIGE